MSCPFTRTYFIKDLDFCDKVIQAFEESDAVRNNEHVALRRDQFMYDSEDLCREVHDHLMPCVSEYLNEFNNLELYDLVSHEIKVQKTPVSGGFHNWHAEDVGKEIEVRSRKLVWTMYLNDVEHGGETEFLYQSLRVKPEKGKVCIWPAHYTHLHRGNPPLSGVKYIATGWLLQDYEVEDDKSE